MNDVVVDRSEFVRRYDQLILDARVRELYGGGDYYNVGCWDLAMAGPGQLAQACSHLVRRVAAPALRAPSPLRAGDTLVDVGCGLGAGTAELAALFPQSRVVGVNLSQLQLDRARARHPGIPFVAMDATRLGFADASVRCMVSIEAAFHFAPRTAFLGEAFRVLRPGGMLLMSDMLFNPSVPAPWWAPAANARQDWAGYLRECRDAGFAVDAMEDVTPLTLAPFCQCLMALYPGSGMGEAFAREVSVYMVVALRKP